MLGFNGPGRSGVRILLDVRDRPHGFSVMFSSSQIAFSVKCSSSSRMGAL